MRPVNQVIRQRRKRHQASRRNPLPILSWLTATVVSLLFTAAVFASGWFLVRIMSNLPPIEKIEQLLNSENGDLKVPTRIFDREGKTVLANLENPAIERVWIEIADPNHSTATLSPDSPLARAIIGALEPTYNQPSGLSLQDFIRPKLDSIAQRLAYELLLWHEADGWQKTIRAKILGEQIVQRYGKFRTLIWYLNSAKFGPLVYGAETASRLYFSKPADQLDILEAAALVSVLESPSIHPLNAPEVVRKRTGDVLVRLLQTGWIKPDEISIANLDNLKFPPTAVNLQINQPTYVNLILQQLGEWYPVEVLERGGWEIITTIDQDLQHNLECTLQIQLDRLNRQVDLTTPPPTDCPAAFLLPGVASSTDESLFPLQSQAVILDLSSNQILAVVGLTQKGEEEQPFEYTSLEKHTAGTILTPFVYLAAFARGIQPASLQWDIPLNSEQTLSNLDGKYHGPIRARLALANDYLVPAYTLYNQIGAETVLNVTRQLGLSLGGFQGSTSRAISSEEFFFSSTVSILEIAKAYQVFANQGWLVGIMSPKASDLTSPPIYPFLIQRVTERNGRVLFDINNDQSTLQKRSVISPELAYLITHVLSDEAARWHTFGHPNPFEIGRRSAAKLGRTLHSNEYWAVGYTPQRLVAVWLGNDRNPNAGLKPSSVMNLWHALMQYSSQTLPALEWQAPTNLLTISVCDPSGMLPDQDCPSMVNEIFISGFEPRQTDQLFETYIINEQSGRLATVFTPLELVKEQRYMIIPPEAQAWALSEGIPLPPKEYDTIQLPSKPSENAQITSPQMFSYVRGTVEILGSASGEAFQYYRLQVGEGLFPRRWIQLGTDNPTPVKNGKLGGWDTQGTNGLFTLQLQVIGKENRVETAIVQLTVDNTPPSISITFPKTGRSYSIKEFPSLTFQIQAADDLGIKQVELYLDGKKIQTLTQPPFVFPWQTSVGSHQLSVLIYDLAGNHAQAEANFTITP